MFALRSDVVRSGKEGREDEDGPPIPRVAPAGGGEAELAGAVHLRRDKRPRPLVLRANVGDCLEVHLTNLLERFPTDDDQREGEAPATRNVSMHAAGLDYFGGLDSDGAEVGRNESSLAAPGETRTYRWYAAAEGGYLLHSAAAPVGGEGDGGQVGLGLFGAVMVQPRDAAWYRSQVTHEVLRQVSRPGPAGNPVIRDYDQTETVRGERLPILNLLRQIGPKRFELVHNELNAIVRLPPGREYCGDADRPRGKPNNVQGDNPHWTWPCGRSYREFTVLFHDELKVRQAFTELDPDVDEAPRPLQALRDNMGINYGAAGLGAIVLSNRRAENDPARDCAECKLEEFFLTSWANGDPALVIDRNGGHARARYPEDPSNVHHSYLGDPVRFRNIHAGPKETHVFHLHTHQWQLESADPGSAYLDSQTISPGASFTYKIQYHGSGNRNLTPGDAIFHCHLYPHFAQGMWELWRVHDTFEDGSRDRWYPDGEPGLAPQRPWRGRMVGTTPSPAVVPLPGIALPPMPTPEFPGYPFYIAAEPGHRPSQPPLDFATAADGQTPLDGGLPRHYVAAGERAHGLARDQASVDAAFTPEQRARYFEAAAEERDPERLAKQTAARVRAENADQALVSLQSRLTQAELRFLPEDGTAEEKVAMAFHAGDRADLVYPGIFARRGRRPRAFDTAFSDEWWWRGRGYPSCDSAGNCFDPTKPVEAQRHLLFRVNGRKPKPGAPYADPCPDSFAEGPNGRRDVPVRDRHYRAAYIQFDMTVNKAGWHDPQARIAVLEDDVGSTLDNARPPEPLFMRANSGECVSYTATNLVPSALNLDDFQVFSPTDTIGQHIHLVKFDVTSSDGSGNGWNYEDGTFSPDEVRERLVAQAMRQIARDGKRNALPRDAFRFPRMHDLFRAGGAMGGHPLASYGQCPEPPANPADPEAWRIYEDPAYRWCGAQSTVQRWWADPLFFPGHKENGSGYDYRASWDKTLRTVFTHDHFGPSSHQQHGLYAALVVQPSNSVWRDNVTDKVFGGSRPDGRGGAEPIPPPRADGGPTSYAARIEQYDGPELIDASDSPPESRKPHDARREYNLAFADYALLYTAPTPDGAGTPVNPPTRKEALLPLAVDFGRLPRPEGISTRDPGSQLLNYRHEPMPLRLGRQEGGRFVLRGTEDLAACRPAVERAECAEGDLACAWDNARKPCRQGDMACIARSCDAGDLANVFSSRAHAHQSAHPRLNLNNAAEPPGQREPGDPATPLLWAFDRERTAIRMIQGAQEENHIFTLHGARWLAQPDSPLSGWTDAQPIGISEHFEAELLSNDPTTRRTRVPGLGGLPRDRLYMSSAIDNLWDGQWGLFRILGEPPRPQQVAASERTGAAASERAGADAPVLAASSAAAGLPPRLPPTPDERRPDAARAARAPETDPTPAGEAPPSRRRQEAARQAEAALNAARPGEEPVEIGAEEAPDRPQRTCPEDAPVRTYFVEAWRARDLFRGGPSVRQDSLQYSREHGLYDPNATMFIEARHRRALQSGRKRPEPLVLRAAAGECIHVVLLNQIEAPPAGPGGGAPDRRDPDEVLATDSHNLVPPIVRGFNLNQIRASDRVSLHPQLVRHDNAWRGGGFVGGNIDSTVPPHAKGERVHGQFYEWFAGEWAHEPRDERTGIPIELGAVSLFDLADPILGPARGAVGALVVLPRGARWETDCDVAGQGRAARGCLESAATVYPGPYGDRFAPFRDFVIVVQDALALHSRGEVLGAPSGDDDAEDTGHRALNYATEPLWARLGAEPDADLKDMNRHDYSRVFSSRAPAAGRAERGDPATPVFLAPAGMPVRVRLVHPGGHPRNHSFSLAGHQWPMVPWRRGRPGRDEAGELVRGSDRLGEDEANRLRVGTANAVGPARHLNLLVTAGGACHLPGDYLYRAQNAQSLSHGMWGILRVYGPGSEEERALHLPAQPPAPGCGAAR